MGGRTRPPCPSEYKAELVRLVREEGRSPSELAREFEVGHVAIQRALGQARPELKYLGDGRGSSSANEEFHKLSPTLGVELAGFMQAGRHQFVGFGESFAHQRILQRSVAPT